MQRGQKKETILKRRTQKKQVTKTGNGATKSPTPYFSQKVISDILGTEK